MANIRASLKETLKTAEVDEFLFGKQLEEQVKAANLLEKSTKELKPLDKTAIKHVSKNTKGPFQQTNRKYVQSRPPQRKSWGGNTNSTSPLPTGRTQRTTEHTRNAVRRDQVAHREVSVSPTEQVRHVSTKQQAVHQDQQTIHETIQDQEEIALDPRLIESSKKLEIPATSTSSKPTVCSIDFGREETSGFLKPKYPERSSGQSESWEPEIRPESPSETLLNSVSPIAGRLRFFINKWKEVTSDRLILSWIEGYKIRFESFPTQVKPPSALVASAKEHVEISKLISILLN
ncbi:hypothetical protein KPH14_002066 [Odynerus spinipes]|uniref:Uncharacterized protein n=1 Tax=Odynerus spinipes TaxID=1348599 RepID=A0AAD9VLB6_9HYME|nr:hypothetical protein KPH14_002066 [Odynerus spinipes]